jgi:endonuclease YncB( thermonuclease family)
MVPAGCDRRRYGTTSGSHRTQCILRGRDTVVSMVRSRFGRRSIFVAALALGLSHSALAQSHGHTVGQARTVDGDTIQIGTAHIRLWGIDAPETGQHCAAASGVSYACGLESSTQLRQLILSAAIDCEHRTVDRYKRIVALCRVGKMDLGAEMVRAGWALAFVRYSSDYVSQEQEARAAKRGLWAGSFQAPWEWRRR